MPNTFEIRPKRTVPIEDLSLAEVTVLPAYFIEAEDADEALGEFYWTVPIENHDHFAIDVNLREDH